MALLLAYDALLRHAEEENGDLGPPNLVRSRWSTALRLLWLTCWVKLLESPRKQDDCMTTSRTDGGTSTNRSVARSWCTFFRNKISAKCGAVDARG